MHYKCYKINLLFVDLVYHQIIRVSITISTSVEIIVINWNITRNLSFILLNNIDNAAKK